MQSPLGHIILEAPTLTQDLKVEKGSSYNNRLVGEGTLQDADTTNRNGRDYEQEDLFGALNDPRLKELMRAKSLFAEDGHPLDKSLQRQQVIYKPLTCASFLSIWTEGKYIKARFKGTNNDRGEYFDADLRDGVLPAWSLRALGSLQSKNGKVYVKNLRIITWDSVVYPSHKCAYTEKIVSEGARISGMGDNQKVYPENWQGEITPIMSDDAIEYIKNESANLKLFCNTFEAMGNSVTICEGGNKIQLVTANGSTVRLNLENYIANEIMEYCTKK